MKTGRGNEEAASREKGLCPSLKKAEQMSSILQLSVSSILQLSVNSRAAEYASRTLQGKA